MDLAAVGSTSPVLPYGLSEELALAGSRVILARAEQPPLLAAALFLTAPAVLVSASSTNDDMIAGVPLLIGALFACRWWRTGTWLDALLGAMGLGLSAGSKLHFPMLIPFIGVLILWRLVSLLRVGAFRSFLRGRALQMVAACAMIAILVGPAFAINWAETGALVPHFRNLQNIPFSPAAAGINTLLYSAQLFLAPIPDLYISQIAGDRKSLYDAFDAWFNTHAFYWVTPDLHYSFEPSYYFHGLTPEGYLGAWEQSVWLGFIPWLLLIVLILGDTGKG